MHPAAGSAGRAGTGARACAEGSQLGGGANVRRGGARSLGEGRGEARRGTFFTFTAPAGTRFPSPVQSQCPDCRQSRPRSWTEFWRVPGRKALLCDGLGPSGSCWCCGEQTRGPGTSDRTLILELSFANLTGWGGGRVGTEREWMPAPSGGPCPGVITDDKRKDFPRRGKSLDCLRERRSWDRQGKLLHSSSVAPYTQRSLLHPLLPF